MILLKHYIVGRKHNTVCRIPENKQTKMCDGGITKRKKRMKTSTCSGKRKVRKVVSLVVTVQCLRGNSSMKSHCRIIGKYRNLLPSFSGLQLGDFW